MVCWKIHHLASFSYIDHFPSELKLGDFPATFEKTTGWMQLMCQCHPGKTAGNQAKEHLHFTDLWWTTMVWSKQNGRFTTELQPIHGHSYGENDDELWDENIQNLSWSGDWERPLNVDSTGPVSLWGSGLRRGSRGSSWHSEDALNVSWQGQHFRRVALRALHSTFYTQHSPLYTLHSTLNTLHSTLHTLHSTVQQSTAHWYGNRGKCTVQITCFSQVFYVTAFGFVGCILFWCNAFVRSIFNMHQTNNNASE